MNEIETIKKENEEHFEELKMEDTVKVEGITKKKGFRDLIDGKTLSLHGVTAEIYKRQKFMTIITNAGQVNILRNKMFKDSKTNQWIKDETVDKAYEENNLAFFLTAYHYFNRRRPR